jgi:hypothetical protein
MGIILYCLVFLRVLKWGLLLDERLSTCGQCPSTEEWFYRLPLYHSLCHTFSSLINYQCELCFYKFCSYCKENTNLFSFPGSCGGRVRSVDTELGEGRTTSRHQNVKRALALISLFIQKLSGAFPTEEDRPERELDNSPPSTVEAKNYRNI